jgi:hypothetical protein
VAATKNLIGYNTAAQIVCSNASLATGSARESATVDNTTNLFDDYLVQLTFTLASGSPSTAGAFVNVWVAAPANASWPLVQLTSGAPYTTGGGDSSVGALATPTNLRLLGTFVVSSITSAGERTLRTEPMSVAAAFSGNVPKTFSIVVDNEVGVAFSASTATTANYVEQTGIYTTSGNP